MQSGNCAKQAEIRLHSVKSCQVSSVCRSERPGSNAAGRVFFFFLLFHFHFLCKRESQAPSYEGATITGGKKAEYSSTISRAYERKRKKLASQREKKKKNGNDNNSDFAGEEEKKKTKKLSFDDNTGNTHRKKKRKHTAASSDKF